MKKLESEKKSWSPPKARRIAGGSAESGITNPGDGSLVS